MKAPLLATAYRPSLITLQYRSLAWTLDRFPFPLPLVLTTPSLAAPLRGKSSNACHSVISYFSGTRCVTECRRVSNYDTFVSPIE